jgi:uridylate kinase
MNNSKEVIVISVGGSLVVPNDINLGFLRRFKEVIERLIGKGFSFAIISGGGRTARHYMDTMREFSEPRTEDIDWIGIDATRMNANLLRVVFNDVAENDIVTNPTKEIRTDKPVILAGGWKPGASTDHVAVQLAKNFGSKKLVNLTNIDFIYNTAEVNETGQVNPVIDITWDKFLDMLPKEWVPGAHLPFDPVASKLAKELGLEVANINGQILDEFEKYVLGERFRGTLIH